MGIGKKITILLPCLNEEKTLGICLKRIKGVMKTSKYRNDYKILVCDNGSTDNSLTLCKKAKVDYIICDEKGYGATLNNGVVNSDSEYIVMLDCDLSYNEKDIPKFIDLLEEGNDLVVGNRFKGTIEKRAMNFSHKIGVRFLTSWANFLFKTKIGDYHSGLRAFKREKILKCKLNTKGFEYASEMIIKAKLNGLVIKELTTDLFLDGRNSKSHLNTIRDGYRHLHLINKLKFNQSVVFRYFYSFFIVILSLILFMGIAVLIPQKAIYNNTVNSLEFFEKYYVKINGNNKSVFHLEAIGDIRNISMAYNLDNKKPIDSIIRMSYQEQLDYKKNMRDIFVNKKGKNANYSRYWQGQAFYSRITLLFMPLGYFQYSLQLCILIILFLAVIKKLLQINWKIAVSYIIMNISISAFHTAFSVQYFFALLLMHVFTLILIKLYKKESKYIDLMLAISGTLTCYFDFLTCETLTLTIPLFIYAYLSIEDGRKVSIKTILKYIIVWGVFYSLTFMLKWGIDALYFGFEYLKVIFSKMFYRIDSLDFPFYLIFPKAILLSFSKLIPFYYIKDGMIYVIIILLISLYELFMYCRKYISLLLIVLIPFIRYFLISTHSYSFGYYTYRAFGVLVLLVCLLLVNCISRLVIKIKNNML